jgi:hypothetical protein
MKAASGGADSIRKSDPVRAIALQADLRVA